MRVSEEDRKVQKSFFVLCKWRFGVTLHVLYPSSQQIFK